MRAYFPALYCTVLYCTILYCTVHSLYLAQIPIPLLPPNTRVLRPVFPPQTCISKYEVCSALLWFTVISRQSGDPDVRIMFFKQLKSESFRNFLIFFLDEYLQEASPMTSVATVALPWMRWGPVEVTGIFGRCRPVPLFWNPCQNES